MKRIAVLIALNSITLPACADGSSVMKAVSNSMTFIQSELPQGKSMSGSGVIFMEDEVLTNCHVVNGAEKITVQFADGEKTPATIKGRVGKLDMCALSAITGKRPKVNVANLTDIKVGQQIYAVGNPLNLKLTISDGIVSAIRDVEENKVLQITAPISPGSSGGGVFDGKGRLLGLTTFTLTEGQNLNFAIPVEYRNTVGLSPIQTTQLSPADSTQATQPTKSVNLICRGSKKVTTDLDNVKVEQTVITIETNLDEGWISFKDDWGCNLDYEKKMAEKGLCDSKLKLTSKDNKRFNYFNGIAREAAITTEINLDRTSGLLTMNNMTILNKKLMWIMRIIELNLNCAQENNKF